MQLDPQLERLQAWFKAGKAEKLKEAMDANPIFSEALTYLKLHPRQGLTEVDLLQAQPTVWGSVVGKRLGESETIHDLEAMAVPPYQRPKPLEPDFGVAETKTPETK